MSRLLVSTFQNAGRNLAEAQLFKAGALRSKLITTDRTNELWSTMPASLAHTARQPGVLKVGATDQDRLFGFLQLSMSQGAGWARVTDGTLRQVFERFLMSLCEQPIDCWLFGGHHHFAADTYDAMSWGTAFETGDFYRPYVGFGIDRQTRQLEWFGFRKGVSTPRDIPIDGAAPNLRSVSLLMIMGCNGIPWLLNGNVAFDVMARTWRSVTKPALILGWFGVHGLPLDSLNRHASDGFWTSMETLKLQHGIGDGEIGRLVAAHPDDVIQAWGRACHEAFAGRDQSDLWRALQRKTVSPRIRGCGAVRPDGVVFHANAEYAPNNGRPAMVKAGVVIE